MNDIDVAKNELKKCSKGEGYISAVCLVVLNYIENLEKSIEEKQKHLENLQKVNEKLEERIAIKELTRCKDCKHKEKDGISEGFHYCNINGLQVTDDWFCADGKPKAGDPE